MSSWIMVNSSWPMKKRLGISLLVNREFSMNY